jgi:glycine betaine/choline ABC-type transport system substrate-binding protein
MDRTKVVALILLLLTSCSSRTSIVVGSKNFSEQIILGEIIAQHIERRLGVGVDRKLNLGGTLLAHQALTSAAIDLYPEYTGTALTAVLKQPASGDKAAVLAGVRAEYGKRWGLTWLEPLGFNNTFAMVVNSETAKSMTTISDAANSARSWRLGVGYEFIQRPDGLAGLLETYKLRLQGQPVTMDLGLLYQALQSGKVDMVAASSTDGLISVLDVKVLEDDKNYFPPYECAIVVREDTLRKHPELRPVLEQLSGRISGETMRKLNHAVDGQHRPAREVASEFLDSGLVHLQQLPLASRIDLQAAARMKGDAGPGHEIAQRSRH